MCMFLVVSTSRQRTVALSVMECTSSMLVCVSHCSLLLIARLFIIIGLVLGGTPLMAPKSHRGSFSSCISPPACLRHRWWLISLPGNIYYYARGNIYPAPLLNLSFGTDIRGCENNSMENPSGMTLRTHSYFLKLQKQVSQQVISRPN